VDHRATRDAFGWAGADTARLGVWIDDWRMKQAGDAFTLRLPPGSARGGFGLELRLRASRPPVLHGRNGLSPKEEGPDPHASWYLSLPRLETAGTLVVGGRSFSVSGLTWMDHEFFSGGLPERQAGWDWFSARLEDGRDLMLYRLRGRDGSTDYVSGTVTSADGADSRPVHAAGAVFDPLERWRSPASGASYPVAWRVELPAEGLELRTRAPLLDQEVRTGDAGLTYWEGLVDCRATWRGEEVRGEGYVEMTGYARRLELP
jgi:predicted secreted hydrolase